nr:PTS transporter subunit EIIB [Reinekea blandensis]
MLQELGGKDNVIGVLACATSRLRIELRQETQLDDTVLKTLGVTHVMKISDQVVHLLMGEQAADTEQALQSLLA